MEPLNTYLQKKFELSDPMLGIMKQLGRINQYAYEIISNRESNEQVYLEDTLDCGLQKMSVPYLYIYLCELLHKISSDDSPDYFVDRDSFEQLIREEFEKQGEVQEFNPEKFLINLQNLTDFIGRIAGYVKKLGKRPSQAHLAEKEFEETMGRIRKCTLLSFKYMALVSHSLGTQFNDIWWNFDAGLSTLEE